MASLIKTSRSPWASQTVTVGGETIKVVLKWNDRDSPDGAWYVDITDLRDNVILSGLKVMPNQSLTTRYNTLDNLPNGNLWCFRLKNNKERINRDNLGSGKTYALIWMSYEEERSVNINGRVQI